MSQHLSRTTAHPRAGGENLHRQPRRRRHRGSSPRGRGKLSSVKINGWSLRLIPARAGKTPGRWERASSARAHPRAGGENHGDISRPRGESGSSPRGRGKPWTQMRAARCRGLIPARAGKTTPRPLSRWLATAHPRAGGENINAGSYLQTIEGSSPRGRGKRQTSRTDRPPTRLIPARAGKTQGRRASCSRDWAHPRAGGENTF